MYDEVMYVAVGHATSYTLWQAIELAFESTSRAQSLSIISQM